MTPQEGLDLLQEAGNLASNKDFESEELKDDLLNISQEYVDLEEELTNHLLLGDELYATYTQEEKEKQEIWADLTTSLEVMEYKDQLEIIKKIQNEAAKIFNAKLTGAKSSEQLHVLFQDLNPDEKRALKTAKILELILSNRQKSQMKS